VTSLTHSTDAQGVQHLVIDPAQGSFKGQVVAHQLAWSTDSVGDGKQMDAVVTATSTSPRLSASMTECGQCLSA
jgi:hypothetical protein